MKTEAKGSKLKEAVEDSQIKEIKTDMPLSEKDEVKDAEKRTGKSVKDNSR